MLTLREYCLAVDKDKPDFLAELIESGKIPESCDSEKKLNKE
jgi:hypothetical protein